MSNARRGLSPSLLAAVRRALSEAGVELDRIPAAYGSPWARAGLLEASASPDGLGAFPAQDAGGNPGGVEP